MDEKKQSFLLNVNQTCTDGLDDWEPVFDEEGSLILTDRPTEYGAFRALLKVATELKRLVDCAPQTENGIRADNRNAFRMTMQKLNMVGHLANSSQYRLEESESKGDGVITGVYSPKYSGSSIVSIVGGLSILPFTALRDNGREIEQSEVDLFLRRYKALSDFFSELPAPDDPDFQPITAFPIDLRARIRQAATPNRKTLKVRKRGDGKNAEYSRVDVIHNWEDDFQRWRKPTER